MGPHGPIWVHMGPYFFLPKTVVGERGLHAYMPYHLGLVELSMEFQGFLMYGTVLFAIYMESCIVGRRSV